MPFYFISKQPFVFAKSCPSIGISCFKAKIHRASWWTFLSWCSGKDRMTVFLCLVPVSVLETYDRSWQEATWQTKTSSTSRCWGAAAVARSTSGSTLHSVYLFVYFYLYN